MSWDLMSYLSRSLSWAGGTDVGKDAHVDASGSAGAGTMTGTSTAHDLLGGMVGGFGGPMEWKGAGFGAQGAAKVTNRDGQYLGANAGLGFGGGSSNWTMNDGGGKLTGSSGVAGGIAPVGLEAGNKDVQGSATTNLYSGVGGSAYTYDGPGGHGVGLKGSAVPLGAADTNLGLATPIGTATAHADDMYLGKATAGSTFGVDGHGVYKGQSQASVLTGAEGIRGNLSTPIGDYNAGAGSVTFGAQGKLGGSYDPRTGNLTGNAGFNDGLNIKDVSAGYSTPDGELTQHARVGSVFAGVQGSGDANWDASRGQLTGQFQGSGGGVNVKDIGVDGQLKGVGSYYGQLGEFSNDTQIKDGHFSADKSSATIGGSADGMGMRFLKGKFGGQVGSGPNAVTGEAGFGSIGNNNSITNFSATANYSSLKDASLAAHADEINYAGWTGSDMYANLKGPGGVSASTKLGHFGLEEFDLKGADARIDSSGASLGLKSGTYSGDLNLRDLETKYGTNDYYQAGKLGEFATDKVAVENLKASASWDPRKGASLSTGKASYDEVLLKGVGADTHLGNYYDSHIGLGEGSMNHFDAASMQASANLTDGISASIDKGNYSFLAGKNLDVTQKIAGGAAGFGVHADQASLGGISADKLAVSSTLEKSHLEATNFDAHGWKASGQQVDANLGKLGLGLGSRSVSFADLHVGDAHADRSDYGTKVDAGVSNADLTLMDIQGGHAGLGWGGTNLASIDTSLKAGASVEQARGKYDLLAGTADASFKNASVGGQIGPTNLNLLGHNLALPSAGGKIQASGGASLDVSHGAASANIGLGGSNLNIGGHNVVTVPDWVQAGGGVNLSQGAANMNLGGANGVGADVNLAKGQLDVNAFGHHVDVAQGVRDVGSGLSSGAHAVGNFVSHLW